MKYIHSVIMQSGEIRRCHRSEVPDDLLLWAGQAITTMLRGEKYYLPDGCIFEGELDNGDCLVLRLSGRQPEVGQPLIIASVGIAVRAHSGSLLWHELHQRQIGGCDLATNPGEPPVEPWCAIRFQNGADHYVEEAEHLLFYFSALAWAWFTLAQSDINQFKSQENHLA